MAIPSQGSIPSPIGRLLAWAFVLVLAVALASQFLSGSDDEVRVPTSTLSPATTTATTTPPTFWMNKYEWALKDHIDALATLEVAPTKSITTFCICAQVMFPIWEPISLRTVPKPEITHRQMKIKVPMVIGSILYPRYALNASKRALK